MQENNNNEFEKQDEYNSENNDNSSINDEQNSYVNNEQNSSYYTSPYTSPYVSSYNAPNDSNQENTYSQPKSSNHTTLKVLLGIVAFIVVAVLLIVCLSTISTLSSKVDNNSSSINADGNSNEVSQDEQLYIVKNSPKIELTQNTDVDYVPQSIPEVVQKIGDSVVEISTSSVVNDRFFHQYVTSGAGSGVLITQSDVAGYLLTNHHVIDGATEIIVRLTNGEEYIAQLLGSDASLDLAVLRIDKKSSETFTVSPIGDSTKLLVGQKVIAIGNPLGSLGGTVTDGIISALDRTVKIDDVEMVLLQHNAAINPGNSGGGLFDDMGNLIGIVNAKTSETGIEGLGFAIPIDIAYNYFLRVMVIEPSIGIRVAYGRYNNIVGVYVTELLGENTGFQKYDRIISVNGRDIETDDDYYDVLNAISVGDTVTFKVRRNSANIEVKVAIK